MAEDQKRLRYSLTVVSLLAAVVWYAFNSLFVGLVCLHIMPNPPCSTNNSLSAGLHSEESPQSSPASIVVSLAPSAPLGPSTVDSITEAVVRALGNSLPTMQLAHWVLELFLNPTGFPVPGQWHKVRYP